MGQDRIHKFPPIHTNRIGKDDLWAMENVANYQCRRCQFSIPMRLVQMSVLVSA